MSPALTSTQRYILAAGISIAGAIGLYIIYKNLTSSSNGDEDNIRVAASTAGPGAKKDDSIPTAAAVAVTAAAAAAVAVLAPGSDAPVSTFPKEGVSQFIPFTLLEKIPVTHNTFIFRFALPSADHTILGVPPLRHLRIRAMLPKKDGAAAGEKEEVCRTYTPLSSDFEMIAEAAAAAAASSPTSKKKAQPYFDLLIKVYEGGALTPHLSTLGAGAAVEMCGATGRHRYDPRTGIFHDMKKQFVATRAVVTITGGTGVTPMIQLLKAILCSPDGRKHTSKSQTRKIFGLYANSTLDDVLCQEVLEAMAKEHPEQFTLQFTVSRKTSKDCATEAENKRKEASWPYFTGRVDEAMLRKLLALPAGAGVEPPSKQMQSEPAADGEPFDLGTICVLCGPPAMVAATKDNLVKQIGFSERQILVM